MEAKVSFGKSNLTDDQKLKYKVLSEFKTCFMVICNIIYIFVFEKFQSSNKATVFFAAQYIFKYYAYCCPVV